MDYVIVEGKSIFYRLLNWHFFSKNKPVLIFLHEGLGCSSQWKTFPDEISEKTELPVLLYDRYGYGFSEEITELRKPDFLQFEAEVFLPSLLKILKLNNHQTFLFGHSDGGTIALNHAAVFPHNTKGIITEAAHVFTEDITLSGLQKTVQAYNNGTLRDKLVKFHSEKTDSMFKTWTEVWLSAAMKTWNIELTLKQITCPVLAVQGVLDNYGSLAQIESIVQNTSGKAESLVLENCGHIPHHEQREKIVTETVAFILKNIYNLIKN